MPISSFPRTSAILLASGKGKRSGMRIPKQYAMLGSAPMYVHSMATLLSVSFIKEVVLVVSAGRFFKQGEKNNIQVVRGGRRRQDSVAAGLSAVSPESEVILVHDCARPFLTTAMIKASVREALKHGASAVSLPCGDTIKEVRNGFVKRTLPRENLFRAQTPQSFRAEYSVRLIRYLKSRREYTDETSALEKMKIPVKIVSTGDTNIKITTGEDMRNAEYFIKEGGYGRKARKKKEG